MEGLKHRLIHALCNCFRGKSSVGTTITPRSVSPLDRLHSSPSLSLDKEDLSGITLLEEGKRRGKSGRRPKVFPLMCHTKTLVYYREGRGVRRRIGKSWTFARIKSPKVVRRQSFA